GDQGIWLLSGDLEGHLPAAAREVADVTGARDTLIATPAVGACAGATPCRARLACEGSGGNCRRQVRSGDGIHDGATRHDRRPGGRLTAGRPTTVATSREHPVSIGAPPPGA